MKDIQLHEIAMLALSKTVFASTSDPVELAKEMFSKYNNVIDALQVLNKDLDEGEEIDAFGMPQS